MKLVWACPVFSDYTPEFVLSMRSVDRMVNRRGWELAEPDFVYEQGSLIVKARNEIAKQVLATDADYVIWADADMRFSGETVEQMIDADEDFVGVAYPSRNEDKFVLFGDPGPIDARGLAEVSGVGFGLVLMKRHVLELAFHEDQRGEDRCFCDDWRAMGGKIYILADATVGHVGRVMLQGNYIRR